MASGASLPAMLSQPLVASTIELDNEFEARTDHRTARRSGAASGAPWLVSRVMWAEFGTNPDGS
jgi:hypothetical protein